MEIFAADRNMLMSNLKLRDGSLLRWSRGKFSPYLNEVIYDGG